MRQTFLIAAKERKELKHRNQYSIAPVLHYSVQLEFEDEDDDENEDEAPSRTHQTLKFSLSPNPKPNPLCPQTTP